MSKPLAPLPPTPESVALLTARHARYRPPVRRLFQWMLPLTWEGSEQVPAEGPLVVLSNHVMLPDSVAMNVGANRLVVMMGSEVLAKGPAGRLVLHLGLSPKKKNTPDSKAVRVMKAWVDSGAAIGIFPEGQRTWDGRHFPLVSGIEKLVLLLGVPVVTMRIYNGYRVWPRWAPMPRRGRVHVEVDAPVTYSKKQGAAFVLEDLRKRVRVDDADSPHWDVRGFRLAAGISNVLYACPSCGRMEGLAESGDELRCAHCREKWRVTSRSTLIGSGGERSLAELVDTMRARFEQEGWRDSLLDPSELLRSEPCVMMDNTGDEPIRVGSGRLVLRPDELALEGEGGIRLPLRDVAAATVENRRRFWIRTRDGRVLEPVMPRESVIKWEHLIARARAAHAHAEPPAAAAASE